MQNAGLRFSIIGLQTIIEYLNARLELGGIKKNASVNTKITEEQYEALKKELKKDKDFKKDKEIVEKSHAIDLPKNHYGGINNFIGQE